CPPPHPFAFRPPVPFVRVAIADQTRFDLCLTDMPTVVNRQKLRSICDLPPSPCVPAPKPQCAWRLPEDRCQATSRGAHEIPLLSPDGPGTCHESHPLVETAGLEMKPSLFGTA